MNGSISVTDVQRDALQELGNVAMGSAADSLARQFDLFVSLSIPTVELLDESTTLFNSQNSADELLCCGYQAFSLNTITAISGVAINHNDLRCLATLQGVTDEAALLQRLSTLLGHSALNAVAELLSLPAIRASGDVLMQQSSAALSASLLAALALPPKLCISMIYQFENQSFEADGFLLFDQASTQVLIAALDVLLAD